MKVLGALAKGAGKVWGAVSTPSNAETLAISITILLAFVYTYVIVIPIVLGSYMAFLVIAIIASFWVPSLAIKFAKKLAVATLTLTGFIAAIAFFFAAIGISTSQVADSDINLQVDSLQEDILKVATHSPAVLGITFSYDDDGIPYINTKDLDSANTSVKSPFLPNPGGGLSLNDEFLEYNDKDTAKLRDAIDSTLGVYPSGGSSTIVYDFSSYRDVTFEVVNPNSTPVVSELKITSDDRIRLPSGSNLIVTLKPRSSSDFPKIEYLSGIRSLSYNERKKELTVNFSSSDQIPLANSPFVTPTDDPRDSLRFPMYSSREIERQEFGSEGFALINSRNSFIARVLGRTRHVFVVAPEDLILRGVVNMTVGNLVDSPALIFESADGRKKYTWQGFDYLNYDFVKLIYEELERDMKDLEKAYENDNTLILDVPEGIDLNIPQGTFIGRIYRTMVYSLEIRRSENSDFEPVNPMYSILYLAPHEVNFNFDADRKKVKVETVRDGGSHFYRISPKNSDYYLTAPTENYPEVNVTSWDDEDNQKWRLGDAGDGFYRIRVTHNRAVLHVSASRMPDVNVRSYNERDNQYWRLVYMGDGYYRIESKAHEGMVLQFELPDENEDDEEDSDENIDDDEDSDKSIGLNVNIGEWTNSDNQRWKLELIDR